MAEEVQPASQEPVNSPSPAPAQAPAPTPVDDTFDIDAAMDALDAQDAPIEPTPAAATTPEVPSTEPASPVAASVPSPQPIPLQLRIAAQRLGATDAQIDAAGLEGVAGFVASFAHPPQAPAAAPAPTVDPDDPLSAIDFGKDDDGKPLTLETYFRDPTAAAVIKHLAEGHRTLKKQLAEQAAAQQTAAQRQQAEQARAQAAPIDAAFAKVAETHKEFFSTATIGSVPQDELQRRQRVLNAAQHMPGDTIEAKIAAAVKAIHGEGSSKTDKALQARTEQFKAGALRAPTNRAGSQEPKGEPRLRRRAKEYFANLAKQNAAAEENGDLDLESLPD